MSCVCPVCNGDWGGVCLYERIANLELEVEIRDEKIASLEEDKAIKMAIGLFRKILKDAEEPNEYPLTRSGKARIEGVLKLLDAAVSGRGVSVKTEDDK